MTLELLRDSKVAKLMRRISQQNIVEGDELKEAYEKYQIKERAEALMTKWRQMLQTIDEAFNNVEEKLPSESVMAIGEEASQEAPVVAE